MKSPAVLAAEAARFRLVPIDMTPDMMRAWMRALRFPPKVIEETIEHLGPDKGDHCAGFVRAWRAACAAAPESANGK